METTQPNLEVRRAESRPLAQKTQEKFDRGRAHLEAGELGDAVLVLYEASKDAPDNARIRSFLGLAVARSERDFERAKTLCESATKQEFFNPVLYLNLARVYLIFERRSEAMRFLRRGQMIDPGHPEIRTALQSLGRRRDPVVPFLPRRHLINRRLGAVRNLLESSRRGRVAA